MNIQFRLIVGALAVLLAFSAAPAAAYMGPGVGLGLVATVFGAIAAFFMMIAGLVWYPVKIMLRKRREKKAALSAPAATAAAEPVKAELAE